MTEAENSSPITVESTRVSFEMVNGRKIVLPPSYGTFHDKDGEILPRCMVVFGPWKNTRRPAVMNRHQRRYFGPEYKAKMAKIASIPKEGWKQVGKVVRIYYTRRGVRAPDPFQHPFKSRQPTLSKNGRLYKLEAGSACIIDDRGYVFPIVFLFLFFGYVLGHFGATIA